MRKHSLEGQPGKEVIISPDLKIHHNVFAPNSEFGNTIQAYIQNKNEKWIRLGEATITRRSPSIACWELIEIYDPDNRRKGIGSMLVNYLIKYLKSKGVKEIKGEISPSFDINIAEKFWKNNGFTVIVKGKSKNEIYAEIHRKLA